MVIVRMTSADYDQLMTNHNHNTPSTSTNCNDEEFEAAHTLFNLPYLITGNLSFYRFACSWLRKSRRSALHNPPPPLHPPSLPPLKTLASSPDTPLSFSPTDSDANNHNKSIRVQPPLLLKKNTSLKRSKEELQLMVDERLQTKKTLMEEIEKVMLHLENLKAQNSELKAKKHKLIRSSSGSVDEERERTQLEAYQGLNPMTECSQPKPPVVDNYLHAGPSSCTQDHHQQPLIPQQDGPVVDRAAYNEAEFRGQVPYQQLGPRGFDLNVAAEELVAMESAFQPLDQRTFTNILVSGYYRAQAARAARENRRQITKSKKPARVR